MVCEYIVNGIKGKLSYDMLLLHIDDLGPKINLENFDDVVFSITANYKQSLQANAVSKIQYESKEEKQYRKLLAMIDGDVDYNDSTSISLNQWLEDPACVISYTDSSGNVISNPVVTHKNDEDYHINFVEKMVKEGFEKEEAEKLFEELQKKNDILLEDSESLHKLFNCNAITSRGNTNANLDFELDFKNYATERLNISSRIIGGIFNDLRAQYVSKIATRGKRIFKNVNIKTPIKGFDKDVFGHIDYITIDEDGTLNLYNFKVSTQDYKHYPEAKINKYKALMVFLKYMLAAHGVNIKNANLHIIPVLVVYNDDYSKVTGIHIRNPKNLSEKELSAAYALENFDRKAEYFIQENYPTYEIDNNDVLQVNKDLQLMFPNLNIRDEGIGRTAEEWIRNAPSYDSTGLEPIVIENVHLPGHGYNVKIKLKSGEIKTIAIKSDKPKTRNLEILNAVREHVSELTDSKTFLLNQVKKAIRDRYKRNLASFSENNNLQASFLNSNLGKYFTYTKDEKGNIEYEWELVEDLSENNVLMFRHVGSALNGIKPTYQVDVITLSAYDLRVSPTWDKGDSVLGNYRENVETNAFKGDFGNIELIRTMAYLNRIAPSFNNNTFKLGNIIVMNTQLNLVRSACISALNRRQFSEVLKVTNLENSNAQDIPNNLENCSFIDEVGVLLNDYSSIVEGMSDAQREIYDSLGFDVLKEVDRDQQEGALFNIMSNIRRRPGFDNNEEVLKMLKEDKADPQDKILARLLVEASSAYMSVTGGDIQQTTNLSQLDLLAHTSLNVPDANVRIVAENLLITHDQIASEFMDHFYGVDQEGNPTSEKSLNLYFEEYFEAKGYSRAQGVTIGNEALQFANLYERDAEGNNLMRFKNPYINTNDNTYLDEHERKLLKVMLFAINNITYKNNFNFTSPDSEALIKHTKDHPEYFNVPLERASAATTRQSWKAIKKAMKHKLDLVRFSKSKERFEETVNDILNDDSNELEEGFNKLSLENTFVNSMPLYSLGEKDGRNKIINVEHRRKDLIDKYGAEFFETNLKNLMIDYLFKSISTEQYNKLLIGTKALLLKLYLTNEYGGNKDAVMKEEQYIQDYLKVNVFLRSIMEEKSRKIMSYVMPIKNKVTNMLLMGNVVSYFRDIFQGVLENTTRAVIKMNTDISPKNVAKAYAYVTKNATSDARAVNILSKLCLRYRLSNTDVGRISERAKSARNGILNWDNWAYGTLRSPDFLNRMTLFVSKCMLDGCWEAWYLDENGELKYDWRKDSRFNLLANNEKVGSDEWNSQRSLYFSKIREYNLDHPELIEKLEYSLETDLPTPYSNNEILSIRSIGDNIYGSYDKSKKSMYEYWALGVSLGMFTTWFNGIYNNYFSQAGLYATNKLTRVQDTDAITGKPLFINPDTSEVTTNEVNADGTRNVKVYKTIPIITQGIFPTLGSLWKILHREKDGGYEGMKAYLKANEGERLNLRKLLSDLLVAGLFLILFKGFFGLWDGLGDEYKDYKAHDMKENSIFLNLVTEILYKSSSRSYDSFLGPLNVVSQLGDNMNPPYYQVPYSVLLDTYRFAFGNKTFDALMTDHLGFTRAFKDSYKAEVKKAQSNSIT